MHGWYSEQMKRISGTVIYSTPDGGELEVTCVNDSATDSGTKWPDIVYLGEVDAYLRQGDDPWWPLGELKDDPSEEQKVIEEVEEKSEGDRMVDFFFPKGK